MARKKKSPIQHTTFGKGSEAKIRSACSKCKTTTRADTPTRGSAHVAINKFNADHADCGKSKAEKVAAKAAKATQTKAAPQPPPAPQPAIPQTGQAKVVAGGTANPSATRVVAGAASIPQVRIQSVGAAPASKQVAGAPANKSARVTS